MKIAVSSQNIKFITEHAGKCRKFWIYEIENGVFKDKQLLELPIEQTFHESKGRKAHPLDGTSALITRGMGLGMHQRLLRKDISPIVTDESDPDTAVSAYLEGKLNVLTDVCHDEEQNHSHRLEHGKGHGRAQGHGHSYGHGRGHGAHGGCCGH